MADDGFDFFKHDPIRLDGDDIRVLEVLPDYSCLSYQWGEAESHNLIIMNGFPFPVRDNLYEFLRRARELGFRMKIWIDALCIDQENVKERNHQVAMMSNIYRQAGRVFVWIGDVLKPTILPATRDRLLKLNMIDHVQASGIDEGVILSFIFMMRASGYWQRVWIIQELFLARRVELILGDALIDFWAFANLCRRERPMSMRTAVYMSDQPARLDARFETFCYWADKPRAVLVLEECLHLTATTECTDRRDRIYSMLGLCPDLRYLPVRYEGDEASLLLDVCLHVQPKTTHGMVELAEEIGRVLRVVDTTLICRHSPIPPGHCVGVGPTARENVYANRSKWFGPDDVIMHASSTRSAQKFIDGGRRSICSNDGRCGECCIDREVNFEATVRLDANDILFRFGKVDDRGLPASKTPVV